MAGRKQNPIKDITDTVSAWLGGNRGTVNPQVRRTISQTKRAAKTIDQFATGGLGAAAVADAQRMAASGSSTPSALYKTAAVNLAAGAVGAKSAQVAGRAVAKTGIPARVANKLTGQTVVVHGSATKNLKRIDPRIAPNKPEAGSVVFASRPLAESPIDMEHISRVARHYVAERSAQVAAAKGSPITRYEGSMYVAKVPTKTLEGNWIVTSPTSAKVVKELPISGPMPYGYGDLPMEDVRKLERAFRRAGGRPLKEPKAPKTPKQKRSSGPTRS